uniref:G-protein alpha subunit n=1 Tax=Lotharella globosa TaxID=91324 RepID=A0A7S3YYY0_9EUKA
MGVCSIAGGTTDRVDMVQDARVTDQLKVFHDGEKRTIRILLVGAGECGKSTIIKQMKILHKGGFTDEEKIEQMRIIRANTVHAMQQLITGCNELQFAFDEKEQEWTKEVEAIQETDKLTEGQILAIENLWKESKAIKRAVERRSDFYLYDSFRYFLDRIRISYQEDYVPSNQCMLKSRTATSGIKETNFIIEEVPFVMYDVGGQRGERKKWIHCFDGVRSIMFVCSLAEYDLVLAEDRNKNRMEESRTNNESNLALTLTVTPALAPILIITLILTLILGSSVKLFEGILSLVWFRSVLTLTSP